jgi:hypothetical protein
MWLMSLFLGKMFTFIPHLQVLSLLGLATMLVLIFYVIHKKTHHWIFQYRINTLIDNLKKIEFNGKRLYFIVLLLFLVWIAFVYFFIAPSNTSFRSPIIYLVLTGIYWIILPISGLMGLIFVKRYVIDKNNEYMYKNLCALILVSFFGLLGLSILMDRVIHSGVGDNLELRVLPYLLVFSACGAACALSEISTMIVKEPWKKLFVVLIIVAFVIFSISSLLKATNDPSISDFKIYYTPEEKNGIDWIEINSHQNSIWFGEGRFSEAFKFESSDYAFKNVPAAQENATDVFIVTHNYLTEQENFNSYTKEYDNDQILIFRKN